MMKPVEGSAGLDGLQDLPSFSLEEVETESGPAQGYGSLRLTGAEVPAGARRSQILNKQLDKVPGANYSPWTGNPTPIFPNNRQGRGS